MPTPEREAQRRQDAAAMEEFHWHDQFWIAHKRCADISVKYKESHDKARLNDYALRYFDDWYASNSRGDRNVPWKEKHAAFYLAFEAVLEEMKRNQALRAAATYEWGVFLKGQHGASNVVISSVSASIQYQRQLILDAETQAQLNAQQDAVASIRDAIANANWGATAELAAMPADALSAPAATPAPCDPRKDALTWEEACFRSQFENIHHAPRANERAPR